MLTKFCIKPRRNLVGNEFSCPASDFRHA